MSQVERRKLIADFCVGYVLPPLSQFAPTLYRARINEAGRLFFHRDELWAPPTQFIRRAGRLNKPGERTLYVSGQPFSAVFETKPELGTMISVLACRSRPGSQPLQLAPVAMLELQPTRRFGPLNRISQAGVLGHPAFGNILKSRGLVEQWSLQDNVIGKLLITDAAPPNDQELYDLTNGVRDHLFRTWPEYDGITYPSIVTVRTNPNTAIEPKRWHDIEPLEVWVTEVSREMIAGASDAGMFFTKPLLKHGVIQADGTIDYRDTRKTFFAALNDFKEKYGFPRRPTGLEPMLVKPWVRRRISWGLDPDRVVLDF